jgi:hypothetical protein
LSFSLIEEVRVGETIDFTVGYGADGNYYGDATGISATMHALTVPCGNRLPGDLNFDGCVDHNDLSILMARIRAGSARLTYDLNGDGKVDVADARLLTLHFTISGGAPCN